jgi:hypothetical protein
MFPHDRDREIARWPDVARRSRLFGRDAPPVAAMVCRALSVVSIGGLARPFAEGVVLRRRICGAESCSPNLAHPRTIDPNEGVDQFGHATQAIGPEMAAMICPLDRSDDGGGRAPYAAAAASSAG